MPVLTFLFFVCATVFISVFLLAFIKGSMVIVEFVTSMATLILSACVADGGSLVAYTMCVGLVQINGLVKTVLHLPKKLMAAMSEQHRMEMRATKDSVRSVADACHQPTW